MSQPAYSLRSVGTAASGTAPVAGAPAGIVAGDLLLRAIICRNNADTFVTPANWTRLTPRVNFTWGDIFARIATADSNDTIAALSSSGTNTCVTQAAAFSGNVYTDLTTIVSTSVDQQGAGAGSDHNSIQYSDLTVQLNACLLIALGGHNKTTTGNGCTVDALTGFTQIGQSNPNGSSLSFYWGYVQQTNAANISAVIQTRSGTVEALQQESVILALRTANVIAPKAARFYSMINQGF